MARIAWFPHPSRVIIGQTPPTPEGTLPKGFSLREGEVSDKLSWMQSLLNRIWYRNAPWWTQPLEIPLAFASLFYGWGVRRDQVRKISRVRRLPRPVLSVGNLTVGGTGKTPVVQFLAREALRTGRRPAILSRGYGIEVRDPLRVDPDQGDWRRYGDEPLMLARLSPDVAVWIGKDRFAAGMRALEEDPRIEFFLLDDGFQHRQLFRDLDLVLVDGRRGWGNGRLLPWGPLREPSSALSRADRIGWVMKDSHTPTEIRPPLEPGRSFRIDLGPVGWNWMGTPASFPLSDLPRNRPAHLVSGIGAPESFERTARECGMEVFRHSRFPDHHPFSQREMQNLQEQSRSEGTCLVTTEKDASRMVSLPMIWTEDSRPIIIQLGLKTGDGTDSLKEIVKIIVDHEK